MKFILTVLAISAAFLVDASKKNHEQQGRPKIDAGGVNGQMLLNEILLDYDSYSRPTSAEGPCHVQVSIEPTFISWKDDQLKTLFSFEQTWMDTRLKFVGQQELKLTDYNSRLWLPDTVFQNSLDESQPHHGLITIRSDGQVTRTQRVLLSIPCPLEPTDVWSQDGLVNCTSTISSRSYSLEELTYSWYPNSSTVIEIMKHPLRKMEFLGGQNVLSVLDAFNSTPTNGTIYPLKVEELSVMFTVQTEFTKSVLHYLTKKAMKDL